MGTVEGLRAVQFSWRWFHEEGRRRYSAKDTGGEKSSDVSDGHESSPNLMQKLEHPVEIRFIPYDKCLLGIMA